MSNRYESVGEQILFTLILLNLVCSKLVMAQEINPPDSSFHKKDLNALSDSELTKKGSLRENVFTKANKDSTTKTSVKPVDSGLDSSVAYSARIIDSSKSETMQNFPVASFWVKVCEFMTMYMCRPILIRH